MIAPCLAITLVDSNCLSALWITPSEITSSYAYNICAQFNTTSKSCMLESSLTSDNTFVPPFIYSYQCSSSLLVQYVPLFMAMYGVSGIIIPFGQYLVVKFLRNRYDSILTVKPVNSIPVSTIHTSTDVKRDISSPLVASSSSSEHVIIINDQDEEPEIQQEVEKDTIPTSDLNETLLNSSNVNTSVPIPVPVPVQLPIPVRIPNIRSVEVFTLGFIAVIHWPWKVLIQQHFIMPNKTMLTDNVSSTSTTINNWNIPTRYKIQSVTCNIIASIGVLLTFGLAYPPLSIVITIYICNSSLLLQFILQNHYKDSNCYLPLLYQIAKECQGFTGLLYYSCTWITLYAFLFLGVFLLDITSNFSYFIASCICGIIFWIGINLTKKYYYHM